MQTPEAREKEILNFWRENEIFEKTEKELDTEHVDKTFLWRLFGQKEFVFYDGPPFATGLPHYGHIVVSLIKDAIPRYKKMNGYAMRRIWGWDCHGLPLEVEIEKEIGIKNKKGIEEYGIDKFNDKAKEAILRHEDEWKKFIPRIGRFVNMEASYKTADTTYTQSVWNIFCKLNDNGYIEKGFRSLHLCPRCSTTLSNNEVSEGYKDVVDIAVYIAFKLKTRDEYLLAWTTTIWTLLGNVALAVNRSDTYVVVKEGDKKYILHKDTVARVFGEKAEIEKEIKGIDLVGLSYEPINEEMEFEDSTQVYKVYHGDHVSSESGSGVVHMAPAYGYDDMLLAQKHALPIKHHVSVDGEFLYGKFKGLLAKEKNNPKEVDKKILEHLKKNVFKAEEITHSYPLCWRCDTPLLNYATDSWLVNVPKFKDKIVKANQQINWIPKHLRDGRFGNWLLGAPEWAVSRSRFWGAPIPVWVNEETQDKLYVPSIEKMFSYMKPKNRIRITRHAQSQTNLEGAYDTVAPGSALTPKGRKVAKKAKKYFNDEPDIIYASPFKRTKETVEILSEGWSSKIIEDERLKEIYAPDFLGKVVDYTNIEKIVNRKGLDASIGGGESIKDCYKRILSLLEEIDEKYSGKKILIVTHNFCLKMAMFITKGGVLNKEYLPTDLNYTRKGDRVIQNGIRNKENIKPIDLNFINLKRNDIGEIDLHRPHIENVVLEKNGLKYYHCKEVFDCWFESGCVPYAQASYPFSVANDFDPHKKIGFPADFISEAMDQTRGWFYTMLVIGVGAFGVSPYKNVITAGLIRAKDGQKMSKKLKNYTNPMEVINKYGADSLRYYLLKSPVVQGCDMDFDDVGVDEVYKKVLLRLHNCFSFYSLVEDARDTQVKTPHSKNILDIFIISRLSELRDDMTKGFEAYRIDEAAQPIAKFIDDLSTWYIRRSRDRLRESEEAKDTLRFTLLTLSKLIAPVLPFYAEYLYRNLTNEDPGNSVHLQSWVGKMPRNKKVVESMNLTRRIVSQAHELRKINQIKVRQPLQTLYIDRQLKDEYITILKNEVNVKDVIVKDKMELDLTMTKALQEEGLVNEIIRKIQVLRKMNKLDQRSTIDVLCIDCDAYMKDIFSKYETSIVSHTKVNSIEHRKLDTEPIRVNEHEIKLGIN